MIAAKTAPSFTDAAGRTWPIAITVWSHRQVERATSVHLVKLVDDELKGLTELLGDPGRFVDVLWVLVSDQATALGVTDEQFGRSLAGDSLDSAQAAFVEALIDFMPNAHGREALRKLLAAARVLGETAAKEATAKVDEILAQRS